MRVQLKSTFQCSENWNLMTPTEKGRHCEVCQKEVLDITNFTDFDLRQLFQQKQFTTFCARATSRQFNAPIETETFSSSWGSMPLYQRILAVAIFCFFPDILGLSSAWTQDTIQEMEQVDTLKLDSIVLTTPAIRTDSNWTYDLIVKSNHFILGEIATAGVCVYEPILEIPTWEIDLSDLIFTDYVQALTDSSDLNYSDVFRYHVKSKKKGDSNFPNLPPISREAVLERELEVKPKTL